MIWKRATSVAREFREFAVKGNVVDMAVGIIIGGAFTPIVRSIVDDLIMPPVGLLLGGTDFSNFFFVLKQGKQAGPYASLADAKKAGAVSVNYGAFVNTVFTFLIVAFAVFLLIRAVNRLRRLQPEPAPAPTQKSCPFCATTIPLAATRCPACTSQLPPEEVAPSPAQGL